MAALGAAREYTLKWHLQDAEHLIQLNKDQQADIRDEMLQMEERMKKQEMEMRNAKREAMNAIETNNRMKE